MKKQKILAIFLSLAMILALVAACASETPATPPATPDTPATGTEATPSDTGEDEPAATGAYENYIVLDFFPRSGGAPPGIFEGWFAEEIRSIFNMSINFIVDPGGDQDALFMTRSAGGDLGDFHRVSSTDLADLYTVGLIADITELVETRMPYYTSQFPAAVNRARNMVEGHEGRIFGVPNVASTQSPFTPTFDGVNPQHGSYMRQDAYFGIGAPPINTLDDLLPVLKQMQEYMPYTESGAPTYGFTIWQEWDGNFLMHNADRFGEMYKGYQKFYHTTYFIDPATRGYESYLDPDGIYKRALRLYFDANQMGLMDPDSPVQNWDTAWDKSVDGQFLFSWWSWFGVVGFNGVDNRADRGIGYRFMPIASQQIISAGVNPSGDQSHITISPRAQEPERIADFLNWHASPAGFQFQYAGPYTLGWIMGDNGPEVTPWGIEAGVHTTGFTDAAVPPEFGGAVEPSFLRGQWPDFSLILKWRGIEMNPETGFPYDPRLWPSAMTAGATQLEVDWSNQFGFNTPSEMLTTNGNMTVIPAFDFLVPTDPSDIEVIRTAAQPLVNSASWRMVFAANEAEFEAIWDEMIEMVFGLGWETVMEYDRAIIADYYAAWAAAHP